MLKKCLCRATTVEPPVVNSCDNCFYIPNLILMSNDSVAPCGETGEVNILENAKINVCSMSPTGTPLCPLTYQIISYGNGFFGSPSITNGILSFTGDNSLKIGKYTDVTIKVSCSCKNLSTFVNIKIGFKDMCKNVVCANGSICNACSGECESKSSDLSIVKKGISTSTNNITIL